MTDKQEQQAGRDPAERTRRRQERLTRMARKTRKTYMVVCAAVVACGIAAIAHDIAQAHWGEMWLHGALVVYFTLDVAMQRELDRTRADAKEWHDRAMRWRDIAAVWEVIATKYAERQRIVERTLLREQLRRDAERRVN
jgi:hypothetical protein